MSAKSFGCLVLLHSVGDLLKHLGELFHGKAVVKLDVWDGAPTLELMPDAVQDVTFTALNH